VLEAELTALVQEFGAGQAGVEEAVRLGQVAMAEQMQAALAEVVERVAATGSQLEELHLTARTIRADVRRLLTLAQPLAPSGRQIRIGSVPLTADFFQAREAAATLREAAEQDGTVVLTQVLAGMGGVGKTQLAAAYARQACVRGRGWWRG
jgi:hypothetical protein